MGFTIWCIGPEFIVCLGFQLNASECILKTKHEAVLNVRLRILDRDAKRWPSTQVVPHQFRKEEIATDIKDIANGY